MAKLIDIKEFVRIAIDLINLNADRSKKVIEDYAQKEEDSEEQDIYFYVMNDYGEIELWQMEPEAHDEVVKELYGGSRQTFLPYAKLIGAEQINAKMINPMIDSKLKNAHNAAQYVTVRDGHGHDQEYAHYPVP